MSILSAYTAELARGLNGYLDVEMRPKPQRPGEADFFISEAQKSGGPVLELASGACRMMMVLAGAGIEVFGIEASDAMISIGEKAIAQLPEGIRKRIHVIRGDMRSFAFSKKFPLIIIPYHSFWFNFRNVARQTKRRGAAAETFRQAEECICSIMEALASGGRFIIDTPLTSLDVSWGYVAGRPWDDWAGKYGFRYKIVKPYILPKARENDSFSDMLHAGTEVLIGEKL